MKKRKAKKLFYRKWKIYVLNTKYKCDDCGGKILYFCRYDADFCPQCNEWISVDCCDFHCSYCVDRPETPLDALSLCKMLRDNQIHHNKVKERAIRHHVANEKYKYREIKRTK